MSNCIVYYEGWQMDCCGIPFKTKDSVEWLVYPCDKLSTSIELGNIDYCYEAHDSDYSRLFMIEGKVEQIQILYQKYAPSKKNSRYLIPVDGMLVKVESVNGFEKTINEMEVSGYVVELYDYSIRKAKKEEVTFR